MQDPPVLVKSGDIHAKMCVTFKCLYILSAWHQVAATSLRLKFGNNHFTGRCIHTARDSPKSGL